MNAGTSSAPTVRRLGQDDLEAFKRTARDSPHIDTSVQHVRQLALAIDIVANLLGFAWYQQHISASATTLYFRPRPRADDDSARYLFRFTRLAESLYSLQGVPGFETRLVAWRTMEPNALVSELEGARMLVRAGIPFEFRTESGRKTDDFDILIESETTALCGELKTKIESTEISFNSLLNTPRDARTQVPSDRPGVIWVRLPQPWAESPVFEAVCLGATQEFFRNTQRISGVVVHYERVAALPSGGASLLVEARTFVNANCTTLAPGEAQRFFQSLATPSIGVLSLSDQTAADVARAG
jgi:hypothetical protein